MSFAGPLTTIAVDQSLASFTSTELHRQLSRLGRQPLAVKYVASRWAHAHALQWPLRISSSPLQTWGTATYVAPVTQPLSSALYGRVGVVSDFDPTDWTVFDATTHDAQRVYQRWARTQPDFDDLTLTVHSTRANHELRNRFRERFHIDCVLFRPDQAAELHTDTRSDVWMAVSDWAADGRTLKNDTSHRLANGRFTVLIDEDFELSDAGLPIRSAPRLIEPWTTSFGHGGAPNRSTGIRSARTDPMLPSKISDAYYSDSYVHLFIEP